MAHKTLEQLRIERLYKLLKTAEKTGEGDDAAILRWAILELEKLYGVVVE